MPNEVIRLDAPENSDASQSTNRLAPELRPSRAEAEDAIRTLLAYVGEDTSREGLQETPARVVKAYDEWTSGYDINAEDLLAKTFEFLAENPQAARLREEIDPPVRIHPVQAHLVVYRVDDDGDVFVIRIRHGHEDWMAEEG